MAIASIFIARAVSRLCATDPKQEPAEDSAQKKQKKRKRPRRGGGGAWRAFVSGMLRGTRGGVPGSRLAELAEQYRKLSPEQMSFYQEVGQAGARAHAAGHRSFGERPPAPDARIAGPAAGIPAAGEVRADGVIVAADLGLPFQQLQHYQGEETFSQRYLEERSIVLRDMKSASKAEAAKVEAQEKILAEAACKTGEDDLVAHLVSAGHTSSAGSCRAVGSGAHVPHMTCLQWSPPVKTWVKAAAEAVIHFLFRLV